MRYEIRKVNKDGSVDMTGGYVIAPDWQVAGKRAVDAGLVRLGEAFVAIPAYGLAVRCGDGSIPV